MKTIYKMVSSVLDDPECVFRSINYKKTLLTTVLLLFLFQPFLLAQNQEIKRGQPVICPANPNNMFTRVNIPEVKSGDYQRALEEAATAEFEITFGPGAQANQGARDAFQYALDIWATQIVSSVPIKVYADFADLGAGVLASAGPTYNISNFPNAPEQDVFYPAALANSLAGEDLVIEEDFDMVVNLGNGIPWYFGLDGNTPGGLYDFVTIALHEAGHGLGFTTSRGYSAGTGTLRSNGIPSVYSLFMVDGDGNLLLDFPDPSTQLGDAFTGGDLFMDGDFAKAALGGVRPELYAPSTWAGGSSLAHWDEAAFPAGDPNSLMTPAAGAAESNFDIGDITRGLFRDMGWVLNNADAPLLVASPATVDEELVVGDVVSRTIELSNISDSVVVAQISASTSSSTLGSFDPTELTIASTETDSFTVEISAVGLTKGVYLDTILVGNTLDENTLVIPVTVRILDGTEAPIIEVNPLAFDETLEQLQLVTRDLTISNTGDADLNYTVTVSNDSSNNFAGNVMATNNSINTNGFEKRTYSNSNEGGSKSALVLGDDNSYNKIVTSLYATDFEEFNLGILNGQLGWQSQYEANWIISDANPSAGTQNLRGESDGLGSTRGGSVLALSPTITPGDEPFMVLDASVNIQGSGVTWEVIPQSPTEGSVVTRLRFNPDGTIDVLSDPDYTRIAATTPEGYFDLKIVVDKDDATFSIYFDDELVFSGQGFASIIEQAVLLSSMEVVGSTMDVDNLEITDGDPDAFFLSVSPNSGTVPFGSSTTLGVKFDARALSSGVYTANLTVESNDALNSPIDIPVTLTVVQPPTIEVSPDSLSAAVNVQTDDPPTQTEMFTISNTGESTLDFSTSLGATQYTPLSNANAIKYENLDMALYGVGNNKKLEEKLAGSTLQIDRVRSSGDMNNASAYSDSIYYDQGIPFPDNFAGVQTSAYTSAVNFDVENDFTLSAVRNGYRTEAVSNPVVILEIYKGGATPNDGELLLTQTFDQASAEGIVVAEVLSESLSFSAGESFWVVHKYPDGIEFPQGVDDTATQRPDTYFFSSDGGATYSASGFVFFVRALSGGSSGSYISLEPASGSVAPGESIDVSVTFDGASVPNGTHETAINISSNDPVTPVASVATTFEVSGQLSEIELSDEYLLFGDVFVGAAKERSFTITNNGLSQLEISNISSDNGDFTVDQSSATLAAGEELAVGITFAPSQLGSINGIITVESNADNMMESVVVVNGIGSEPPVAVLSPQEVALTTDAGTTIDSQLTLSNEGNSPLIFSFPDLALASALSNPNVQLNNTERIAFEGFNTTQEKGYKDNRTGPNVDYSIGTDNGFGYSWIDSDEAGGPVYNFNDITATGTDITGVLGGDGTAEITLSFPFEFYGESNSSVFVNANGFLTFDAPAGTTYINTQIPTADGINNLIAAFWEDIEPQNFNGSVHAADFGDRFVVQWTDATLYLGTVEESVTFQVVLYADGNIDIFYEDVETAPFINTASIGIENADGSDGAQVAFNTSYLKDGLALRFVKPAIALSDLISNVSPMSGVVPAGGQRGLTVTLDATDLNDGVYYDELAVSSNDPLDSENTSLFELTVIGYPEISLEPDSIVFDSLFIGLSTEASFLIRNVGSKVLEISDITNGNSDFELDTIAPISLQPDQSLLVGVSFTPSSVGLIEDMITITSDDAFGNEMSNVYLAGIGVDPPVISLAPDSFTLEVYEGDSTTEMVSITNNGVAPLNYSLTPPYFGKATDANQEAEVYPRLEFEKIRSKETLDTRVGPQFLNASGGPGTFGYSWVDNNSGGPAYDYIDISTTGQLANVGGDGDETVALPFDFNFFGNEEDSVTIGANGFLTFAPLSGTNYVNQQIPDEANPNLFIAPLWSDIEPQNGNGVFYYGTDEYFIVQYDSVPGFGFPPFLPIPDPVSFQVILFPDGTIKMQYENVNSSLRTESTVGIEGPQGLSGLQVIFNTEYLTEELAITFTPPVGGTVASGETDEVPITFFTDGLEAGETYTGDIAVSSNDPINPLLTIPVSLHVLELPEIVSFTLINADLNEAIGSLNEGDIINLDNYATNSFNIAANTDSVGARSVVFDFNGTDRFKIDNRVPYALFGNSNGGTVYRSGELPKGVNTITATPYSRRNGNGMEGISLTVNFEVIDNSNDICFGESVLSYLPGNRKNGNSLPESRSNPEKALGTPQENDGYNFVALGFGGSIEIALGCEVMDHEGNDLLIVETSFRDADQSCSSYPETAMVEASEDGENWVVIATEICRDGEVDLSEGGLTKASYIRITDTSLLDNFRGGNADGYDLDGIVVINNIGDSTQSQIVENMVSEQNIVANEQDVEVRAYPNPTTDYVEFSLKGHGDQFNAVLYSTKGEIVYQSAISAINGEEKGVIDMRSFPQGLYHFRLTTQDGAIVSQMKLLKQ